MQTGTSAAVTAALARSIAVRLAVPPVVQPPQLKPAIIVTILPTTKPHAPALNHFIYDSPLVPHIPPLATSPLELHVALPHSVVRSPAVGYWTKVEQARRPL